METYEVRVDSRMKFRAPSRVQVPAVHRTALSNAFKSDYRLASETILKKICNFGH